MWYCSLCDLWESFGVLSEVSFCCWISRPSSLLVLSATWNHLRRLRRHFFEVMCWALVLCGLSRVFRLPLASIVTFARIHCHVGVIFHCSIIAECPIFDGLHWSFPWTGNILTLYRWCKVFMQDPLLLFSTHPLSAGPWGGGVHMTCHVTLCFVSSFPSGFRRKPTLPLKVPLMSI